MDRSYKEHSNFLPHVFDYGKWSSSYDRSLCNVELTVGYVMCCNGGLLTSLYSISEV